MCQSDLKTVRDVFAIFRDPPPITPLPGGDIDAGGATLEWVDDEWYFVDCGRITGPLSLENAAKIAALQHANKVLKIEG